MKQFFAEPKMTGKNVLRARSFVVLRGVLLATANRYNSTLRHVFLKYFRDLEEVLFSTSPDLTEIPEPYRQFRSLFDKGKANYLPEHKPYDLLPHQYGFVTIPKALLSMNEVLTA